MFKEQTSLLIKYFDKFTKDIKYTSHIELFIPHHIVQYHLSYNPFKI